VTVQNVKASSAITRWFHEPETSLAVIPARTDHTASFAAMFAGRSATAGSDEPETDQVPDRTPAAASGSSGSLPAGDNAMWTRAVAVGLGAYLISRLCVIAATAVRASQVIVDARADGESEPGVGSLISGVLTSWDGRWYLELVRRGYPDSIPANISYEQLEARAAFFPLYPWTVRVVDFLLPGGDTFAALASTSCSAPSRCCSSVCSPVVCTRSGSPPAR
jgi:hypothetical protein